MSGVEDGSSTKIVCLFVGHVPVVKRVQHTVRVGAADTEHFARESVAFVVDVENAWTLHLIVAADHGAKRQAHSKGKK